MSETSQAHQAEDHSHHRIFLVVVDESEEMRVALRFAALRARRTGGRMALFLAIEPASFHHWAGVSALMEDEARVEAEHRMAELVDLAHEISGQMVVIYIRMGPIVRELTTLVSEDPTISVLILAAGTGTEGPGPLISYLGGKGANSLRIPYTIVPGSLSDEQVDALT